MKGRARIAAALSAAAVLSFPAPAAAAGGFDGFKLSLEEIRMVRGAGEALAATDARLAGGGDAGADLAELHFVRGDLLASLGRPAEAIDEWTGGVLDAPDAPDLLRARAAEKAYDAIPGGDLRRRLGLVDLAAARLAAARGGPAARTWALLGRFGERTGYADIARDAFRRAAAEEPGPDKKAEYLLRAASASLRLRDMAAARTDCTAAGETPGVSPEIARKARIRLAMTYLTPSRYEWRLTREEYAKAAGILGAAAPLASRQAASEDAMEAWAAIFHALVNLRDDEAAGKTGEALLATPAFRAHVSRDGYAGVLVAMGDIDERHGRHREAVRRYEEALRDTGSSVGVLERVARAAEAAGDYVKAMDAYGACLRGTDELRHPKDCARYRAKVRKLSGYLRKNASGPTAEEIFSDDFDRSDGITLDEE